jgi:hypothetical protein
MKCCALHCYKHCLTKGCDLCFWEDVKVWAFVLAGALIVASVIIGAMKKEKELSEGEREIDELIEQRLRIKEQITLMALK